MRGLMEFVLCNVSLSAQQIAELFELHGVTHTKLFQCDNVSY